MMPPGLPRTILMTTDTVGGVWHYALELSGGLGSRGVDVVLATMGPRPSSVQRAAAARLRNVTLCESEFRLEWMANAGADLARAGEWLLKLERQFAPDVVHLNGFVHGALPWTAPRIVVAHSCVLSWWRAVQGGEAPAEWHEYRDAVQRGMAAADAVIAPSRAMLAELQQNYGGFRNGSVVPNGRDAALYRADSPKEPFVLSVGRLWDEAKNAQALARVAPELAWPVRVAGWVHAPDGSTQPLDHVEVLGRCTPELLADYYARAAIYALPARYEPFGLSALEAALSGCALVLGDIPSLRELWADVAVFVAPNDHAALRDAINGLIDAPVWRQEFASRARQRALWFSTDRMVDGYLAAYRSVVAANATGVEWCGQPDISPPPATSIPAAAGSNLCAASARPEVIA
jgi:glycogen synthase